MAGHAPYIMPDGKPLTHYMRAERESSVKDGKLRLRLRGKDELWAQLQHHHRLGPCSEFEAAELRALERVGHRRRRRWMNDKSLRDMAGNMTAQDMEGQFKPVPFGLEAPASVFVEAMSSEHAPVWDGFRNIDMDKEARVLQRWEEYNHGLRPKSQPQQLGVQPAAAAVAAWARVQRAARAALKSANVHSVLELETQVLDLLEQLAVDPEAELLLDISDSFGRLIVHGLAEFHGLSSSTVKQGGSKLVAVRGKPMPGSSSDNLGSSSSSGATQVVPGSPAAGVTCTDVLMALHACHQEGLTQATLAEFLRAHVHGSQADITEEGFVMV